MALRFYLTPIVGTGSSPQDSRRPKYIADSIAGRWTALDYGNEPVMLVAADVTGAEHTSLVANADVTAAPADLENTIGGQLATVQAALESYGIPAQWVTSGITYRVLLRWIARLFLLSQRHQGLFAGRFLPAGITLNSTLADLTATQRQRWNAAAQSLGLDTSALTLATTVRAALVILGNQIAINVRLGGDL